MCKYLKVRDPGVCGGGGGGGSGGGGEAEVISFSRVK